MKKYYSIIFAAFALVLIFSPHKKALAFSTTDINNYFAPDSVYVDHLGGLQVDWHKVQVSWPIGYTLPANGLIMPMINGTSSLPVPIGTSGGPGGGAFIQTPPAFAGNTTLGGGGCAPNGSDNFSTASQNTYGNQYNDTTIWDANSATYVSVAANVTSGTQIYFVYEQANLSGCGYSGASYYSSITAHPQFVAIAAGSQIIAPVSGSTIGNLPAWGVNILANSIGSSTVTGTVEVAYGNNNSSSLPLIDSSTFSIAPGTQQTITIGVSNNLVNQLGGTSTWYAAPSLIIGGQTLTGDTIQFFTNIDAPGVGGTCDNPVSLGLASPLPSSTIYNDFPQWGLSTSGLNEGCGYSLLLTYDPVIGSLTGAVDRTTLNITPTYNPSFVNINKSKNLWNYYNATTTQIRYVAQLINNSDGYTVASNIGSFFLGYSSTSSPLTAPSGFNPTQQCGGICQGFGTIGGGSIATPTSTIEVNGAACPAPADGLFGFFNGQDFAYGICSAFNWLFVPNDSTTNILKGDLNTLETVPPFSWFFQTNAEIQAIANGDTSYITPGGSAVYTINPNRSSTPNNGVSFTQPNLNGSTTTVNLLPADLTSNVFLSSGAFVDAWYNFVLTLCILIATIMVYKIVL